MLSNPDHMANPVRLPGWLQTRLSEVFRNPIHYEASHYGPINALLSTYFPPDRNFLVKPQARLRREDDPSVATRQSTDSYGQAVGTHNDDRLPDFLVCLGSALLHADIPLLLFEVKLQHITEAECAEQLDGYSLWARQYLQQRVANVGQGGRPLWALVMHGSECTMHYFADANLKHVQITYSKVMDDYFLMVMESIRNGTPPPPVMPGTNLPS